MTRVDLHAIKEKVRGPIWRDTATLILLLILTVLLTTTSLLLVERVRRNVVLNKQQEEHMEAIDKRIIELEEDLRDLQRQLGELKEEQRRK